MNLKSTIIGTTSLVVLLTAGAAQSLTGTNTVTSDDVVNDSLIGADIKNESLTGSDLENNSVAGADILNESLRSADVQNESLTGSDIANNSLTGSDVQESTLNLQPTWQDLELNDGAAAYGDPPGPRFAKDASGFVHIEGIVNLGTDPFGGFGSGASPRIGRLPGGFWPATNENFAVKCRNTNGTAVGVVAVGSNGEVALDDTAACNTTNLDGPDDFVSLNGIIFHGN